MTAGITIKCDCCNTDLSDSGPRPDYMLTLNAVEIPSTSTVSFGLSVRPYIDRMHHFCGAYCLKKWLEDRDSNG